MITARGQLKFSILSKFKSSLFAFKLLGICIVSCTLGLVHTFQWEAIYLRTYLQDVNNEVRVFKTVFNVDIQNCIDRCQRRNICQFINYHRLTHTCFLMEHLSQNVTHRNIVNRANFVFGQKSEWTKVSILFYTYRILILVKVLKIKIPIFLNFST